MKTLPTLSGLSSEAKDALLEALWSQNQLLVERVSQLEKQIQHLEDKLKKHSGNSSKPPSSDGFNKPSPRSQRKKSGRKSGGQKGHVGHTLRQSKTPDNIIQYRVEACEHCASDLRFVTSHALEKRQVFDIPELKIHITEHQLERKRCPCCLTMNSATCPDFLSSPVQYGARIKGLMVYLNQYQLLPFERLREFFIDVFEQRISHGTLQKANEQAYKNLEETERRIAGILTECGLLHADETGVKIDKKLHWLHVACNKRLTHYGVHEKRGCLAMDAIGILPTFTGTLVHDHFKPYFHYGTAHALCNAHHLRELTFIQERFGFKWSFAIEKFLLQAKHTVEKHCATTQGPLPEVERKRLHKKYMNIIYKGRKETPHLQTRGQTKARCLLERLRRFHRQVLAFIDDPCIPFDNNMSERDIRMMKVQQKISGCFRTLVGAKIFCRIRGFISTVKKNGINVLEAINRIFLSGNTSMILAQILAAE